MRAGARKGASSPDAQGLAKVRMKWPRTGLGARKRQPGISNSIEAIVAEGVACAGAGIVPVGSTGRSMRVSSGHHARQDRCAGLPIDPLGPQIGTDPLQRDADQRFCALAFAVVERVQLGSSTGPHTPRQPPTSIPRHAMGCCSPKPQQGNSRPGDRSPGTRGRTRLCLGLRNSGKD
jgi:hypothetical protein